MPPLPSAPPEAPRRKAPDTQVAPPITVIGPRLDESERRLRECIARGCPPGEEIDATLAHAEAQFVAGDYRDGPQRRGAQPALCQGRAGAGRRPVSCRRADRRASGFFRKGAAGNDGERGRAARRVRRGRRPLDRGADRDRRCVAVAAPVPSRPDGRVREPELLRAGPRLSGEWPKLVIASLAGRRYAPTTLPADDPGSYRVERFTMTSEFVQGRKSRIRVRSADRRLVRLDLTAPPKAVAAR